MTLDHISGDRRLGPRFEYEMELRFSYCDAAGVPQTGYGTTADLGSGGIRFYAENPPPKGADIQMKISWAYLLQGTCPLELLVSGIAGATTSRGTVMRLGRYEFRTCGERSFFEPENPAGRYRVA